jgi:hypothetical protein
MATPDKPQGAGPNKKTKGGQFVDPLDKWLDEGGEIPDLRQASGAKNNKKPSKASLQDKLVNNQDKATDAVAKAIRNLSRPGLSRAERDELRRELALAQKVLVKTAASANAVATELKESRRLEAQAYAKLNRIRTWKSQPGNTAGLSKEDIQSVHDTEESLKELIKAMNVFRIGNNSDDEDVKKHMVNKLDELLDRVESMPEEFKSAFKDDESKLDLLLEGQAEAREFVKKQNDAIGAFAMKMASKVGIGAFNLGNAFKVGRAVVRAPGRTVSAVRDAASRVNSGFSYVKKTVEMRRLAKASPIVGPEDPSLAPDFKDKSQAKQTDLLQRYVEESERFHSRVLAQQGKTKGKGKGEVKEDSDFLKGFSDLFGAGGFLKTLLKLAGSVTAVAIAGAIGYWIGSKIWEKIAPWAAEKFNNLSGADQAGKDMSAPVILNTQQNYNRAHSINSALQTPGSKIDPKDEEWYARYIRDNKDVDPAKAYAPNANLQKINNAQSTGGFARMDRMSASSDTSSAIDNVNSSQSQMVPASLAGAGRGNVNPDSVSPTPTVQPIQTSPKVNSGSGLVSDWMGKTMTKNGQVDVNGLNGGLQSNLVNMSKEYYDKTGKKLQLNSAYRSPAEQEALFKSKPPGMAAPPGASLHNFGMAVDVSSSQAAELKNLGLLDKFGFVRPIAKEPWHMQPAGVTVAAAKAGVYSADGPANQGQITVASASPKTQTVASAEARTPVVDSSGSTVQTGSGGKTATVSGGSKNSAASIPTFHSSDGMLMAMNVGALGM